MMIASSCSNTRKLPPGESLYVGATVKIEDSAMSRKKKKTMRSELGDLTRPRPNKKFLGMRFKLFAYNLAGNPKKRNSPAGWLKYTVGEPPVLLSDVRLEYNEQVLRNSLENRGYFHADVRFDTTVRRRKATAIYTARPGPQYIINAVAFEQDTNRILQRRILEAAPKTLLKPGDPFDLDVIKAERIRLDAYLKEYGFYYFSPDFLIVRTDTTIGAQKVNLYVNVKQETPQKAEEVYSINDVYIMPNYRLNAPVAEVDTSKQDAYLYKGYYVVDKRNLYKPRLFEQSMQFHPGDLYNRTDHNLTINRLVTLGIFKFVKNRFSEVPDSNKLNTYYYLTPLPKKSIRAEINANTKSNNLTGSAITLGWRNRNTLRGGELFTIDATGGFEVQYGGGFRGFNTFRAGLEVGFAFPRFLVPFVRVNPPGGYVPKTKMVLGYDILTKQKLYTMHSFRASLGYFWKESLRKEHQFNPIAITYVQPFAVTQLYMDSVAKNPSLAKAIEEQFILGTNYNYNYNGLTEPFSTGFYFNGLLDLSGNVLGLLTGADAANNPKYLFNAQFSQYVKAEADLRYYKTISAGSAVLANRIIVGFGLPYGNSLELPYVKQFFIGGNNSLRAFRSRSVGPGRFRPPPSASFLADQSGDIKLEMNTELRARLAGIVHGAVFVDAGNIWLYNENPNKPGSRFSSAFLKDIAVGAGVGLRFDISFLVLRFDVAFPLRKPWLLDGERWVLNDINFRSPDWRRDNIVFNLGIGYPF